MVLYVKSWKVLTETLLLSWVSYLKAKTYLYSTRRVDYFGRYFVLELLEIMLVK
jgi:hypothetical protein